MTEQATLTARRSITVEATPERAFAVFTAGFQSWWPIASHHIGEQDAVAVILEPRTGGRWFERAADGTECEWGSVIACEPPSRLLLAWHLTPEWVYDPDPANATEVEVTFTPAGDGTLRRARAPRLREARRGRREDARARLRPRRLERPAADVRQAGELVGLDALQREGGAAIGREHRVHDVGDPPAADDQRQAPDQP